IQCDLSGDRIVHRAVEHWRGGRARPMSAADAAGAVRRAVEGSVTRQLRSDVPMCTLLSGGLDSTIVAGVARSRKPDLRSFCAGSPLPFDCSEDRTLCDLDCARKAAAELGTSHAEAHVTREIFAERWPRMIARMGSPLST